MSSPAVSGALLDASPYPHPRSAILTPSSEASLNRHDEATPSYFERQSGKRGGLAAMDDLLKAPITIKAHPPSLKVKPRVLHPMMLLPRKHLPLSSLDLAAPQDDLPQSRFYESQVKILELDSRLGPASSVLIARNESKGSLFAIERHANGLFVLCKLGQWVEVSELARHSTVVCEERVFRTQPRQAPKTDSSLASTTPQIRKNEKVKRNAIEAIQSLVKKRARSQSIVQPTDATIEDGPAETPPSFEECSTPAAPPQASHELQAPIVVAEAELTPQQTAEALFDNIRTHYSEALYKSKGSLAYFAKGPLSRARSTFHLDLESSLDMNELIDFLKSLILTTVQIDKKYRETVPELLAQMKAIEDSSDEARKKRRKPKKMKLGKDGLYPREDDSIREWWTANKPEPSEDGSVLVPMQTIKSRVSLLRSRETQLQMILIMEILALEMVKGPEVASDSSLPVLPGSSEVGGPAMAPPPPPTKKRSKHNLPVLIDVHADRLTIWQSTASDELFLLEDSQPPSQGMGSSTDSKGSTPLKDFCVDVILPFYSSRLTELADSLNRKLGGPVTIAPRKSRPSTKGSSDKKDKEQRPGAAAKRVATIPRKEPRTLERALSFDQESRRSMSRGPSSALAFMRSAASMAMPTIKREDSDSNLGSSHSRSSSLVRSSSMADLRDAKAAKKAKVEAELKDAISTLRKPNREVIGKAIVEAAEKRVSSSLSAKRRKPGRPVAIKPYIQVEATPANTRYKDFLGPKAGLTPDDPLPSTEEIIPPSSIGAPVPATAPRKQHFNFEIVKSPVLEAVGCTPTRPSATSSFLRRPAVEDPMLPPPSSPLMSRNAVSKVDLPGTICFATPAKQNLFPPRDTGNVLLETPIKKSSTSLTGKGNEGPAQSGKENSVSIYAKLGWDDDDDDDLYDL